MQTQAVGQGEQGRINGQEEQGRRVLGMIGIEPAGIEIRHRVLEGGSLDPEGLLVEARFGFRAGIDHRPGPDAFRQDRGHRE